MLQAFNHALTTRGGNKITYIECCDFLADSKMVVKKGIKTPATSLELQTAYNGEFYFILIKMEEVFAYIGIFKDLIKELKKYSFTKREIAEIYFRIMPMVKDFDDEIINSLNIERGK